MTQLLQQRLQVGLAKAQSELLAACPTEAHWTGELSSSALSTATAVCALGTLAKHSSHPPTQAGDLIAGGLRWLAEHANEDGGWGDTVVSKSNISTTTLCWAAFGAIPWSSNSYASVLQKAERWLDRHAGGTGPEQLSGAIIARYGEDRTFSVPILTMCAIAGRLGTGRQAWRHVLPLPFELAALPASWFATLGLPVVSYALPALIAIGQARHFHAPSRYWLPRLVRDLTRRRTLRLLKRIQPASGGFLEATPLTSFVVMSLAASNQAENAVAIKGAEFLVASARTDGSWAIDTNLDTWATTLAVNALTRDPEFKFSPDRARPLRDWLLRQQYRQKHPYTNALPGGWAWTDLPGGVPDADDTAGALLALRELGRTPEVDEAALFGLKWLLDLQNTDGGIPTFCRGWGKLPFDRSSPDLTAHALRAWIAWRADVPSRFGKELDHSVRRAVRYLLRSQTPEGWVPLWFGNQFAPDESNLTYGNARVLTALAEPPLSHPMGEGIRRTGEGILPLQAKNTTALNPGPAIGWLLRAQNSDGAWGGCVGGPESIEETALAVEALAHLLASPNRAVQAYCKDISGAVSRGVSYLLARVEDGSWTRPSPIGFYFAKLWYYEKLYPLIFTVGALGQSASIAGWPGIHNALP